MADFLISGGPGRPKEKGMTKPKCPDRIATTPTELNAQVQALLDEADTDPNIKPSKELSSEFSLLSQPPASNTNKRP